VAVDDGDGRAGGHEPAHGRLAQARRPAGDQRRGSVDEHGGTLTGRTPTGTSRATSVVQVRVNTPSGGARCAESPPSSCPPPASCWLWPVRPPPAAGSSVATGP